MAVWWPELLCGKELGVDGGEGSSSLATGVKKMSRNFCVGGIVYGDGVETEKGSCLWV